MDVLFRMLLGHIMGDYLLQNNYMALNKKKDIFAGLLHCFIWTASVCIWVPEFFTAGFLCCFGLFLSHAILDMTSIMDWFLGKIGGRSYESAEAYCAREDVSDAQRQYMRAYTAIVQTVADNGLHLMLMYGLVRYYI